MEGGVARQSQTPVPFIPTAHRPPSTARTKPEQRTAVAAADPSAWWWARVDPGFGDAISFFPPSSHTGRRCKVQTEDGVRSTHAQCVCALPWGRREQMQQLMSLRWRKRGLWVDTSIIPVAYCCRVMCTVTRTAFQVNIASDLRGAAVLAEIRWVVEGSWEERDSAGS